MREGNPELVQRRKRWANVHREKSFIGQRVGHNLLRVQRNASMTLLRVLELFHGIGGMHAGLELAEQVRFQCFQSLLLILLPVPFRHFLSQPLRRRWLRVGKPMKENDAYRLRCTLVCEGTRWGCEHGSGSSVRYKFGMRRDVQSKLRSWDVRWRVRFCSSSV